MEDDFQIPAEGRGSIRVKHGEFKNVLYVPSLASNMLFVYQMTHTGSPKRVTFDSDLVDITETFLNIWLTIVSVRKSSL